MKATEGYSVINIMMLNTSEVCAMCTCCCTRDPVPLYP